MPCDPAQVAGLQGVFQLDLPATSAQNQAELTDLLQEEEEVGMIALVHIRGYFFRLAPPSPPSLFSMPPSTRSL